MGAVGQDDSVFGCYVVVKSEITCLNEIRCILICKAVFKYRYMNISWVDFAFHFDE